MLLQESDMLLTNQKPGEQIYPGPPSVCVPHAGLHPGPGQLLPAGSPRCASKWNRGFHTAVNGISQMSIVFTAHLELDLKKKR